MKPQFESRWDSFFAIIDDHIGSIRVDLGLIDIAPVKDYDKVILVELNLNLPRPDGLSASEESEKLWEIEDSIRNKLEIKLDTIFAGAETTQAKRRFYFYSSEIALYDKFISEEMVKFPSYEFEFTSWDEENWESYLGFLYPSDEDLQRMGNRDVIETLEERGDDLKTPRQVDHWIYFESKDDRSKFINQILDDGFEIDEQEKQPWDSEYTLHITRTERVNQDNIDEIVLKLFRLAKQFGGRYDGWETEIIKESDSE